jgi:hypothetical protein
MWAINNETPYAAERTWVRDKIGAHHWVVAVKATFDIRIDGRIQLADEQIPCLLAPEYFGEAGASSLRHDTDVVPPKPTTDILMEATAHAPSGKPASKIASSLRIADLSKTVIVHGTRVYSRNTGRELATSDGIPFTKRPIRYEDAFGGTDVSDPESRRHRMNARNPVGKGVALDPGRLLDQAAHCIDYPEGTASRRGPAGFGPIASHWSPRREWAGTYDDRWHKTKRPLLPDDYDDRFLLSAPEDQRPARHLIGGERVVLLNLTPEQQLQFTLPKLFFAFSSFFGRRREEHRARLNTVFIQPDSRRISLVWSTSLYVAPRECDYLDKTRIIEKPYV